MFRKKRLIYKKKRLIYDNYNRIVSITFVAYLIYGDMRLQSSIWCIGTLYIVNRDFSPLFCVLFPYTVYVDRRLQSSVWCNFTLYMVIYDFSPLFGVLLPYIWWYVTSVLRLVYCYSCRRPPTSGCEVEDINATVQVSYMCIIDIQCMSHKSINYCTSTGSHVHFWHSGNGKFSISLWLYLY